MDKEMTQKYNVLFFEQAPWVVGEHERDRDSRVKAHESVDLPDLYPGSYPGQVIAIAPAARKFTPADLADPLISFGFCQQPVQSGNQSR